MCFLVCISSVLDHKGRVVRSSQSCQLRSFKVSYLALTFPITSHHSNTHNSKTLKTSKKPLRISPLSSKAVPIHHHIHTLPPSPVTMTPTSSLPMFLLLLLLLHLVPLTVTAEYPPSVHDVLRSHGLPAGLFPKSVKSYTLDHTGFLEVHMDRPCLAQYETRVFFDSVVRANLSFRRLKVLEGMSQEELFIWLPVKDIIVIDPLSGLIVIDIGLAYKRLSLSRFDNPPICRSQGTYFEPFDFGF